jgi:hypothetical protein
MRGDSSRRRNGIGKEEVVCILIHPSIHCPPLPFFAGRALIGKVLWEK